MLTELIIKFPRNYAKALLRLSMLMDEPLPPPATFWPINRLLSLPV